MAEHDTEDADQVAAVLALTSDLVDQFLFAVLLPPECVGRRVVVKVSVSEDVTGRFKGWSFSPDGRSMDLPLALRDSAASAQFEFRAPLGLRVASVRLLDRHGDEMVATSPCVRAGRTAHLTGLEELGPEDGSAVRARVELGPVADGFVRQSAVGLAFVAALFLLAALGVGRLQATLTADRAGPLAAVALAVPALFLSVQARRPEHSWVDRTLSPPRVLTVSTALLLYLTALYLVTVSPDSSVLPTYLWVAFALQVVLAGAALALLRIVSVPASTVETSSESRPARETG